MGLRLEWPKGAEETSPAVVFFFKWWSKGCGGTGLGSGGGEVSGFFLREKGVKK